MARLGKMGTGTCTPKATKKACGYNFLPSSCFQKWFCVNEGLQKTRSSRRALLFFT